MADFPPPFDHKNFEVLWDSLDEDQQADLAANAVFLPPSLGVLPVIKGLGSFHFSVRTNARKSLGEIQVRLHKLLNSPEEEKNWQKGLQESALVSARLSRQLTTEQPFNEMAFYFKTLLECGDYGAYFAFKAVVKGVVGVDAMQKAVYMVSESRRLVFVDQYLQATPEVRLKFGKPFKRILFNIKERDPVIAFYASLFDRKRDADPFLNNIAAGLRDPDDIMEKEIRSQSPEIKIRGFKALSMMKARIPFHLLLNALENEEVKKVRLAVYSLVENSALGLYPELFDAIYAHFARADKHEAINAFKALVVTGKRPLYALFAMVRQTCPDLMPNIHIEISKLTRLAFFVIQDIALNKTKYMTDNFDINLACVLGMIKKRPERVVKILKAYDATVKEGIKIDVTGFMKKTRKLLQMEKSDIESRFKTMAEDLENQPDKPKSIFHSVFQDPVKKKLEVLRKNSPGKPVDLRDQVIEKENLAGLRLSAAVIYFNGATLKQCDLSDCYMEKTYFKQALFYNVKLSGAVFQGIHFDKAVFINVDAQRATFKDCSFQGARLFNCNFNQADLHDAVFVNAEISKCSFGHADLSCAAFSHARISGVSFATACLDQGEFSHVSARFSRFPSYGRSVIRSSGMDYNARQYQLSFNDLPHIDKAIVTEINMLIFCEFIHYGETKFLGQNKLSLLTAFDIFKPAQADFFQMVPLLLHENVEFPNARPIHPETPAGIADFLPSDAGLQVLRRFVGKAAFRARRSFNPYIEGVFSMGSIGSLAQNQESDIDYWICVNEDIMSGRELELLRQKLDTLEKLAMEQFKIQVTFFLVDVTKARNNDFGGSSQESSGSAQARLLKEEFYRTMIHVAGKLPLWCVLPTPISLHYYHMIMQRVSRFAGGHRYIDLGDIHAIPVNEFFGASIWQMFKWLKSPFKSVIKMALLEKYMHSYGSEPLLCNQYKNEWMNSGTHLKLAQNDSYIILLNHLLDYYLAAADERSVNLVLTCFFLKLSVSKESNLENTVFGLRKILLERCLSLWGWEMPRVFEIGRFKLWDYGRINRLSASIERYMLTKYNKVKKTFESRSQGLMISEDDRRVLERKVDIVFLDKPGKIKKILLVARGEQMFTRLHLKFVPEKDSAGTWALFHKPVRGNRPVEETLVQTRTIEEIGAWLINNRLFTDRSVVSLVPNPTPVTHDDIQKLFKSMHGFFTPELKRTVRFKELRRDKPLVVGLFVSFNFYTQRQEAAVRDYCAVFVNSWGEMFFLVSKPGRKFPNLEAATREILARMRIKSAPMNTLFYSAKGGVR